MHAAGHASEGRLHTARRARVAAHLVDTPLVAAAVAMAVPLFAVAAARPFVFLKLAGAIVCILLGMAAFRWLPTPEWQRCARGSALAVFIGIEAFAIVKSM